MNASRYFVRVFSSGINKWIESKTDVLILAKAAFNLEDPEQSVYEIADGEEEWLAVAAHKLTEPHRSPEATSVLRIDREELRRFGIRVDEDEFGTTGVPRWDRRHRNLVANRDQLLDLVRSIAERCYRGHDLVRRIDKGFVLRALNSICSCPPNHCPDHVKLIAHWCQRDTKNKGLRPELSLQQIEREVLEVEFEDEAIRPGPNGSAAATCYETGTARLTRSEGLTLGITSPKSKSGFGCRNLNRHRTSLPALPGTSGHKGRSDRTI